MLYLRRAVRSTAITLKKGMITLQHLNKGIQIVACVGDRPRTFTDHTSDLACSEGGGVDEQLSRLLHIRLGAFCGSLGTDAKHADKV